MRVPVAFHPACALHSAGPGHPERPERLAAVLEALRAPDLGVAIDWIEAAPAPRAALERVHPARYLDRLEGLSAAGGGLLDADTILGPRSWESILAAAGVALAGVAWALERGTALAATAMGFCFLNNVVLAAREAQARGAARVLIVDWDVHHGNGTQALVEADASVRFVSLHQSPWYPGTGAVSERGMGNVFNVPRPPGLPRTTYVADLLAAVDAALAGWRADLLLVSAGFDSLAGDPLGGFTLEPDDVAHWTRVLRERVAPAPVAAVLEGGYRLDLLAAGSAALVRALG
jgi:acetoin utilization deacetylase AcuC-like enzyme